MTRPPTEAASRCLHIALGVASTLSDTARRVLERSAEQAGFFETGRDRLVMPGFVPQNESSEPAIEKTGNGSGGSDGGDVTDQLGLDPLLIALLKKVPSPDEGWPGPARSLVSDLRNERVANLRW